MEIKVKPKREVTGLHWAAKTQSGVIVGSKGLSLQHPAAAAAGFWFPISPIITVCHVCQPCIDASLWYQGISTRHLYLGTWMSSTDCTKWISADYNRSLHNMPSDKHLHIDTYRSQILPWMASQEVSGRKGVLNTALKSSICSSPIFIAEIHIPYPSGFKGRDQEAMP